MTDHGPTDRWQDCTRYQCLHRFPANRDARRVGDWRALHHRPNYLRDRLWELRLGADTPKRKKAVDRLHQAFHSGRVLGLPAPLLEQAGRIFQSLHGHASSVLAATGHRAEIRVKKAAA